MNIHIFIEKAQLIVYIHNEKWCFKNKEDKIWFWFHILMCNKKIYEKLIYNSILNINEENIIRYYLHINCAIQIH